MTIQNSKDLRKKIGSFGESAAAKYLKDSGYNVLERNYRNKIGELDLICEKDKVIHVVEVKTVIGREKGELIRAEDHLDQKKINKVTKTATLYALEKNLPESQKILIDALLVRLFQYKTSETFPKNIHKVTVAHVKNINVL